MVPQVSPLVQTFLMATRRHMSPHALHECWPLKHSIVPRQPVDEIRAVVTQCLDEDAMQKPLYTTWNMFAWPDSNKNNWKEDCLPYSSGVTVDLSSRMPGIQLALHDEEGKYQGVARVLRFEGHMLVYDLQMNGARWITIRGVSSSLTVVELWSTSDLGNFYPYLSMAPAGLKPSQPPALELMVEYIQTEAGPPWSTSAGLDRFAEWDTEEVYTEEVQDWSHAPSPPVVITVALWGEAVEGTPPARQNIHLVSERFTESGTGSPHEHTTDAEARKTPLTGQVEDAPTDEQGTCLYHRGR